MQIASGIGLEVKSNSVLKIIYKDKLLYLMLIPGSLFVIVFSYIPLAGWILAFKNYSVGQNVLTSTWAGFLNFRYFFIDVNQALGVLRNTLVMNLSTIIINLSLGCIFAILLNEVKLNWFKRLVQTTSFFPFFISFVVVYSIFNSFLAVNNGALNEFLVSNGILSEGINFLGDAKYSWPLIVFVNFWKNIGYISVIFLAAISNIDQDLYKSADIDGAGRFAKIFHITLPALSSTFVVLLIMNSGWLFSSNFEEFYLFTNSTNIDTMQVFDYYIYRYGLLLLNFSYATAVCIMKSFVSILLIYFVNRISKSVNGRGLF